MNECHVFSERHSGHDIVEFLGSSHQSQTTNTIAFYIIHLLSNYSISYWRTPVTPVTLVFGASMNAWRHTWHLALVSSVQHFRSCLFQYPDSNAQIIWESGSTWEPGGSRVSSCDHYVTQYSKFTTICHHAASCVNPAPASFLPTILGW